jgi:hypothetical protein
VDVPHRDPGFTANNANHKPSHKLADVWPPKIAIQQIQGTENIHPYHNTGVNLPRRVRCARHFRLICNPSRSSASVTRLPAIYHPLLPTFATLFHKLPSLSLRCRVPSSEAKNGIWGFGRIAANGGLFPGCHSHSVLCASYRPSIRVFPHLVAQSKSRRLVCFGGLSGIYRLYHLCRNR